MVKNTLVFGIILLFIVSAVSPMVIGYNAVKSESDEFLDKLAFYCLDASGNNGKYEYYKEQLQNVVIDEAEEDVVEPVTTSSSTIQSGGPMDSPWPMKCHDTHHTGRSPYSTVDTCAEKWRFECDWMECGSVIGDDGTIYFGDFDDYLYALHPNGTLKWKYKTGGWIWSTPTINEDGTIYIGSYDTKLYAVNPNGTLKWEIGTGGSIASSPAIANDGAIYFGVMGPGNNGRIYALYPNGTEKWHYDTGYWIVSDPAIGDDGTIYCGSGDTYLYAMNPDGTLKWRFKTGDWIQGHPSIANDGTIYIGSYDDYLYALYPNGTMKWKHPVGPGTETNPSIASDGTIYVGSDRLYAIYPNGTLKWSFSLGADRFIASSSPAISADGIIYTGTEIGDGGGGEIWAINPDGTERWHKKIVDKWVDSSPSIGEDGTVYIGGTKGVGEGGYFFAFSVGELEADADGPHYGLINEPVQFNGSANGGYHPYSWYWDFGDGNTSDEQNPTHIYTYPGNFTVTLTVTDDSSNTSDDFTWAWIQASNDPPNKPSIDGETNGKVGVEYEYTFETTDPEGLQVWYYIEWGDDTNTGWIGPYGSGEEITKSHSWSEKDTYTIRCKAKDPYNDESEWGELEVTMPMNQQVWFLQFLQNHPRMFPILRQLLSFIK